ncbi:hypothetical protein SAMN04489712_104324 [Thermomonospora echinospora]|uniref:Uncharacterized protein n=1 Tax=Thermomonospora echinospora TaxID=1992 RepID=A0A1H5Z420_9ACTN|nr:hypothetical protein [Thermomonospora echinospora]SEG30780.1 hypothetical protein SAMN04489712_104324 [Thermomonospora echinospora]
MSSSQPWPSGQPSPPTPQPPPADGSSARRPRVPKPVVAGLAVTLLVGAVIALGALWGDGPDEGAPAGAQTSSRPAAPRWTAKAAARLETLPALRYTGTFTSSGRRVQARLSVTRAGSAVGTLTWNGRQAQLVSVNGTTYLKGGPVFWASAAGPTARPEDFAGRWSKAPVTVLGFDVKTFLSPSSIAEKVHDSAAGDAPGRVGGRPAHRVETPLGVYWLSAAEPYELLRVEGASDAGFDVVTLPDAAGVLTELRTRVAALGGARDPGVRFEHGELKFVNCNENVSGCTVSLPVSTQTPAVADGSAGPGTGGGTSMRAVLTATISADGRALGSCTAVQPLGPARKATLSCTVTSAGWKAWMRRARDVPGRHEYTAQARVVAEAVSPGQVADLLRSVDRERAGS